MAISPKMRAIIEKVDAADAAYSAGLLATAKEEAEAREKATPPGARSPGERGQDKATRRASL